MLRKKANRLQKRVVCCRSRRAPGVNLPGNSNDAWVPREGAATAVVVDVQRGGWDLVVKESLEREIIQGREENEAVSYIKSNG